MRQKTLSKTKLKIKKPKQSVALTVLEVIFFLYSLTLIFPFAWLIYNSVKDKMEFFLHPWNFPTNIFKGLSNYTVAFKEFGLAKMLLTTLILSFSIPFISILKLFIMFSFLVNVVGKLHWWHLLGRSYRQTRHCLLPAGRHVK